MCIRDRDIAGWKDVSCTCGCHGAVLEPVADSRIVKAVLVLSGSLENMIYMIAVTVVLMCLTMAIICFATNINLYV